MWSLSIFSKYKNKKAILPPGSRNQQEEGDHKGYGRLQCLCIQVTFLLNVNIISKPNSFQEIVRNWEGYYTTVHVRRSCTNNIWETKKSGAAQFKLKWAPISKLLQFHSFQVLEQPTPPHQYKHSSSEENIFRSKYSLSCYFTTDSTFWWQVNFKEGEPMHSRPLKHEKRT